MERQSWHQQQTQKCALTSIGRLIEGLDPSGPSSRPFGSYSTLVYIELPKAVISMTVALWAYSDKFICRSRFGKRGSERNESNRGSTLRRVTKGARSSIAFSSERKASSLSPRPV